MMRGVSSGSIVSLITSAADFMNVTGIFRCTKQVDGFDLAPGIVGINEKLFEPLNLFLQMIESEL